MGLDMWKDILKILPEPNQVTFTPRVITEEPDVTEETDISEELDLDTDTIRENCCSEARSKFVNVWDEFTHRVTSKGGEKAKVILDGINDLVERINELSCEELKSFLSIGSKPGLDSGNPVEDAKYRKQLKAILDEWKECEGDLFGK